MQPLAVLEGQGRARQQMIAGLTGSFLVTMPIGTISFYWTDYGLQGLWVSLLFGFIVQIMLSCYFLLESDWTIIVEKAVFRSNPSPSRHSELDEIRL